MQFERYDSVAHAALIELFTTTFGAAEGAEEGASIGALVADLLDTTPANDISGYIALDNDQLRGAILLTRLQLANAAEAFILSPVAVHPQCQGQGIGQALINHGISQLQGRGVRLLFTYGDPAYYSQVGFSPLSEAVVKAPCPLSQPQGWLCQSLDGSTIEPVAGAARCVPALDKEEYW